MSKPMKDEHPLDELLPEWMEAVPGQIGISALAGNDLAREVCGFIEKAWSLGFEAGKKEGGSDLIEEEPRCPGDKLGGVCPGIESGVNSDCPKWKEEE